MGQDHEPFLRPGDRWKEGFRERWLLVVRRDDRRFRPPRPGARPDQGWVGHTDGLQPRPRGRRRLAPRRRALRPRRWDQLLRRRRRVRLVCRDLDWQPGERGSVSDRPCGRIRPLPGRRGRGGGLQHAARSGADPGTPRRGGTGHHPARGHARHSHRRFDDHRHHAGLRRQRGHGRWGLTDGHRQGVRGNGHRRPPHADAERLALPDWHLLGRRGARAAARHVHRARRAVGLGGQHGLQPHAHLHDRRRPATRRPGPDGGRRHCRLRRIRRRRGDRRDTRRVSGATVFTPGDNAYNLGTTTEFNNCYHPHWGRAKTRTRPATGNHDYGTDGAAGYFNYFGADAGDPPRATTATTSAPGT